MEKSICWLPVLCAPVGPSPAVSSIESLSWLGTFSSEDGQDRERQDLTELHSHLVARSPRHSPCKRKTHSSITQSFSQSHKFASDPHHYNWRQIVVCNTSTRKPRTCKMVSWFLLHGALSVRWRSVNCQAIVFVPRNDTTLNYTADYVQSLEQLQSRQKI